jgi:hypothetical protein
VSEEMVGKKSDDVDGQLDRRYFNGHNGRKTSCTRNRDIGDARGKMEDKSVR